MLEQARVDAENKKNEAAEVVSAIRDAAGKEGVAQYTKDFAGEATGYGELAIKWLIATGAFAAATIGAAIGAWFVLKVPPESTAAQLVQITTTKIVVIGLLFTATVWCGRMYKASKHQQSMNKHRANALKTFQTFVQASNDPGIRDAVLMETTRSIFAITSPGYLTEKGQSPDSGVTVIEKIKAATDAAGEGGD